MILIGNGRVITNDNNNTFIENGCIAIEGNMIKDSQYKEILNRMDDRQ